MIYLLVVFLLSYLALYYDINGGKKNINLWYSVVLFLLILLAGLRYRLGVDTTRYIYHFYHDTPLLSQLTWEDLSLGKDPFFVLMNSIVLSLGGKFYIVQLLNAAFVNFFLFKYIKKHTQYIFVCLLLYFIYQYATINMEEMRASMSLVICLFANDYIIERKWIKGYTLYFISCFFHFSTIFVMIMPLFFFLRLNIFGYLAIFSAFVIGYSVQPYLEGYLFVLEFNDSISDKIATHVTSQRIEKDLSIYGYLGQFTIYIYSLLSLYIIKKKRCGINLLKFEPLLILFLCFAFMSMNIGLVYRFARFYVVYYLLFVTELVVCLFSSNSSKLGRDIVSIRAILLLFPLFLFIAKERLADGTWERYHPYSSVIERSVNEDREKVFSNLDSYRASDKEF